MGLFDWLPGYRTPNIFDAIEFYLDNTDTRSQLILKLKVKKTDMSVRLRSMNLSTKTLNMSMIALLRRLNARRRIMILKVVFKSVICPS